MRATATVAIRSSSPATGSASSVPRAAGGSRSRSSRGRSRHPCSPGDPLSAHASPAGDRIDAGSRPRRSSCGRAHGNSVHAAAGSPAPPPPPPGRRRRLTRTATARRRAGLRAADAAISPGAADLPDLAFVDSNCDGIDGTEKEGDLRLAHGQRRGSRHEGEAEAPDRGGGRGRGGKANGTSGRGRKVGRVARRRASGSTAATTLDMVTKRAVTTIAGAPKGLADSVTAVTLRAPLSLRGDASGQQRLRGVAAMRQARPRAAGAGGPGGRQRRAGATGRRGGLRGRDGAPSAEG